MRAVGELGAPHAPPSSGVYPASICRGTNGSLLSALMFYTSQRRSHSKSCFSARKAGANQWECHLPSCAPKDRALHATEELQEELRSGKQPMFHVSPPHTPLLSHTTCLKKKKKRKKKKSKNMLMNLMYLNSSKSVSLGRKTALPPQPSRGLGHAPQAHTHGQHSAPLQLTGGQGGGRGRRGASGTPSTALSDLGVSWGREMHLCVGRALGEGLEGRMGRSGQSFLPPPPPPPPPHPRAAFHEEDQCSPTVTVPLFHF